MSSIQHGMKKSPVRFHLNLEDSVFCITLLRSKTSADESSSLLTLMSQLDKAPYALEEGSCLYCYK